MTVLLIAGSPSARSRSSGLLDSVGQRLQQRGVEVDRIQIRDLAPEALVLAAANALISCVDGETVTRVQAVFACMNSQGQCRMAALRAKGGKRSRGDLEISPNLRAGMGLVLGGRGTALVGNPQQVAARIQDLRLLPWKCVLQHEDPELPEADPRWAGVSAHGLRWAV